MWEIMVRVIESLSENLPVHILAIGIPPGVEADFLSLSRLANVTVEVLPRLPFEEVIAALQKRQVDYGCVAMRSELKGCLSPSKFSSYVEAEVPILYIGPEKTNTWKVCVDFDGGVWLAERPSKRDFASAISNIRSERFHQQVQSGLLRAKTYFRSFNGDTLAQAITSSLK